MNKPYAIFDMDGTLVDSMGFWKRLAFEYLESHGVKKVSAEILERKGIFNKIKGSGSPYVRGISHSRTAHESLSGTS